MALNLSHTSHLSADFKRDPTAKGGHCGVIMNFVLQPWYFLLSILAGWINDNQQKQIDFQWTLIQVLREKLGPKRILLNDDQRGAWPSKARLWGVSCWKKSAASSRRTRFFAGIGNSWPRSGTTATSVVPWAGHPRRSKSSIWSSNGLGRSYSSIIIAKRLEVEAADSHTPIDPECDPNEGTCPCRHAAFKRSPSTEFFTDQPPRMLIQSRFSCPAEFLYPTAWVRFQPTLKYSIARSGSSALDNIKSPAWQKPCPLVTIRSAACLYSDTACSISPMRRKRSPAGTCCCRGPLPSPCSILRQEVVDDVAINVRQAEVAAGVAVGEPFVVEAKHMKQRGVQIVDGDAIFDARKPNSSVAPWHVAPLETAAGHEHREPVRVMIAAVAAFGDRRTAEFAAPDHRRFIEQTSAFEIADQGGTGAVHIRASAAQVAVDLVMIVPRLAGTIVDVNRCRRRARRAVREDAAVGERRRAIFFAHGRGFAAQIERFVSFGLHAKGGFHRLDAGFEEFVAADRLFVVAVELLYEVELLALCRGGQLPIAQVADHSFGIGDGIVEPDPLVPRRQKAVAQPGTAATPLAQGDEARQILVFAAQTIGNPGPHRGARSGDIARMKQAPRRRVRGVERVHRTDNAKVVRNGGKVRQQLADFEPSPAMLSEDERRRQQSARGSLGAQIDRIRTLAGIPMKCRLRIEQIDLRRPSGHEQHNAVLRFGREMRRRQSIAGACSSANMPARATEPRPAPTERIISRREMGWFMAERGPP